MSCCSSPHLQVCLTPQHSESVPCSTTEATEKFPCACTSQFCIHAEWCPWTNGKKPAQYLTKWKNFSFTVTLKGWDAVPVFDRTLILMSLWTYFLLQQPTSFSFSMVATGARCAPVKKCADWNTYWATCSADSLITTKPENVLVACMRTWRSRCTADSYRESAA